MLSLVGETINDVNMTFEQKQQELDQRIRSIQEIEPFDHYTLDGVISIENWRKQEVRPLFIGKEAHGEAYGKPVWSMCEWLSDDPKGDVCAATTHTWPKTAYVSFGLQNGFLDYDSMPWLSEDIRVAESLRSIAFINIGKYTADTKTPWSRLNALYKQNRLMLHDQIELAQPNIIIGWKTLGYFIDDPDFKGRFLQSPTPEVIYGSDTRCPVTVFGSGGRLFVDAYHPGSITSFTQYVGNVMEAVKAHSNLINCSLPVW